MYNEEIDEKDEWLFDEVTGSKRKPAMNVLNKQSDTDKDVDGVV